MRLIKVTLASVFIIFTALAIAYSARINIINSFANEQLNRYQIKISCLQVSLNSKLALVIDKLCLQHPKAELNIKQASLKWRYNAAIEITDIDIDKITISGSEHLFSRVETPIISDKQTNTSALTQQMATVLQPIFEQIRQLQAPNININALTYMPFKSSGTQYQGKFTLTNNKALLLLRNKANNDIAQVVLNKQQQNISLAVTSNIKLLKNLITSHQLPTTAEIEETIKNIQTSGTLNLKVNQQKNTLTFTNQLTELSVASNDAIANSGVFHLTGALGFTGTLPLEDSDNKKALQLTFADKNSLSLIYQPNSLLTLLEKNQLSPAIITLLKNNPVDEIKLTLPSNSLFTLTNNNVSLSHFILSANSEHGIHHIKLSDINAELASNNTSLFNHLAIKHFSLESPLKITEIKDFTTHPISLNLTGSLEKLTNNTSINLADISAITTQNISIKKASKSGNRKLLMTVDELNTSLAGNIQLLSDKTIELNLAIKNRATNLVVPKTVQINTFDIASEINGNLEDINIIASLNADDLALGNIMISGPALSPKIQIAKQALPLTDLLSLNIQLPTKVELIDGLLDFNFSGQIADFKQLNNTPFEVSVAVTSASGDIDGIWLQELNWQQHFTLLAGKITTRPSSKENLTVELIETPTPISKLSFNTNWRFNKSFSFSANKLKANVLGGSFSIPKIQWPFEHGHSVDVQLNSIDLEQVLALDKKQGIVVTGNISGQLPITYDGEKYTIENGELHNISNGLIQVMDNPAVNELKANNSQLQLAFDALQNLHYHQLSSAVSMADDGYMLLETIIKGRNPDIDNDVNLNLNLSYDLLGLLESLSITQRFEEGLIKGLQKTKE